MTYYNFLQHQLGVVLVEIAVADVTLCVAFSGQAAHDDVIVARLELDIRIFAIQSLLDGFRRVGGWCGLLFGNLLNNGFSWLLLWNCDLNSLRRGALCRLCDLLLLGN